MQALAGEIADGVVEIKACAREPGARTKIAVWSNDGNVDPVGACVGARGARVRMVVNELRGEKIDIVPFSEEPADFVAKALQPAKVNLAALGNMVPHLHWHVIPRFADDSHFPQPVWGARQRPGAPSRPTWSSRTPAS